MTLFTPRLTSLNDWNILTFDFSQLGDEHSHNKITLLPDEMTQHDLFYPWRGNPPPEYCLKEYMNLGTPSTESILTCRKYSNHAIQKIFTHYSDPSSNVILHYKFLREFCERHSRSYQYHEFYLLVMRYFGIMLPCPVTSDILPAMSIQIISQIDSVMSGRGLSKTGNERLDEDINSIEKAVDKIHKYEQKVLLTRFGWYKGTYEATHHFMRLFWESDEGKEWISQSNKTSEDIWKTNTKNKNDRKRAKKDARIKVPELYGDFRLRQCWFCGKFYELPRGQANNLSLYCDDPKCKKSNDAWRQKLKREGESLESLGIPLKTREKL